MTVETKKVVLLDGSMGQELLHRSGRKPTSLWAAQALLDEPQLVHDLHCDYIAAGARVITVNAYSCTPERLEYSGIADRFQELQALAVKLASSARHSAGVDGVRIAGCLPPLVSSYHPEVSPDYTTSLSVYSEVVAQQEEHVDLFLCETVSSVIDAKAVTTVAMSTDKPVWVALSVADDDSGLLRSGEPVQAAVDALIELGTEAQLLNCSTPESIDGVWDDFAAGTGHCGAYANGFTSIRDLEPGGTVESLTGRPDLDPVRYADFAMGWVKRGADIVGGCCEVGPAHIAELAWRLREDGYTISGEL